MVIGPARRMITLDTGPWVSLARFMPPPVVVRFDTALLCREECQLPVGHLMAVHYANGRLTWEKSARLPSWRRH